MKLKIRLNKRNENNDKNVYAKKFNQCATSGI